jgi:hypothetical protein
MKKNKDRKMPRHSNRDLKWKKRFSNKRHNLKNEDKFNGYKKNIYKF